MSTDLIRGDNRGELTPSQRLDRLATLERRRRLFDAPPPPSKPERQRPTSPFRRQVVIINPTERPRHRQLFRRPIEQIDDSGVVVPEWFTPLWKQIAIEVGKKHDVTLSELLSPQRGQRVVIARHECFWRCKKETNLSLPQIGRRFGGRDHTTVLHGIRKHEERMAGK